MNRLLPRGKLVLCCSVAQLCLTLWPHGLQHARLPCPSLTSWSLLKLMSIELVMLSNHLILCLTVDLQYWCFRCTTKYSVIFEILLHKRFTYCLYIVTYLSQYKLMVNYFVLWIIIQCYIFLLFKFSLFPAPALESLGFLFFFLIL